ncbi:MAG: hypothetical protein A2102_06010 [Tenericutes bacterium GWF2_38_8]|nr:MAG: hypothetical protein A2102_06010 [Tenericutes bacterium GWF2_38_8]
MLSNDMKHVKHDNKMTIILTSILITLTFIATLGGIFMNDLYQDNAQFIQVWKSNDLITLFIALPVLIGSMLYTIKKKSTFSLLIWSSMIWFLCYNYAFYVFGASFNAFYLIHLSIYTLSILTMIFALLHFPIKNLLISKKKSVLDFIVVGILVFLSVGLLSIYSIQSLNFAFNGVLPAIITNSGHVTSVVFSLDISMVVLFFILASVLILKRNSWGYVIAFIALLKGVVYMMVLTYASMNTNPAEVPIWVFLGFLTLVSLVFLSVQLKKVIQTT